MEIIILCIVAVIGMKVSYHLGIQRGREIESEIRENDIKEMVKRTVINK